MMRVVGLIACVTLLGCGDLFGPDGPKYRAEFSGVSYIETLQTYSQPNGGAVTCVTTFTMSGFVELELGESGENVSGDGTAQFVETPISLTPGCGDGSPLKGRRFDVEGRISGTKSSFQFSGTHGASGNVNTSDVGKFTGSLGESVVSGTLTLTHTGEGIIGGSRNVESGSASVALTLRR